MKKTMLMLILWLGFTLAVKAQSVYYKTFKVDLDAGGFPSGDLNVADITVEFHCRTSDAFALGLRGQAAYGNHGYASFCLTGDYYLTPATAKGPFRLFTGGGAGSFIQSDLSIFSHSTSSANVGGFARFGFELSHLRLSAEYDITGGESNYLAFNLGFSLGGGRKKVIK